MRTFLSLALVVVSAGLVCSEEPNKNALKRDESAALKKKVTAIFEALGPAPAGFAKEKDNYNLPTEFVKNEDGKYQTLSVSADVRFGIKQIKDTEKEHGDMAMEYQKKILAAQASGDYAAVSKLSQEMTAKASQSQLKAVEATEKLKQPITVEVQLNSSYGMAIDPDSVLFEKPGMIALKEKREEGNPTERVYLFFDPVALKDSKELSSVSMTGAGAASDKKTAVLSAMITLDGPTDEVEGWAKRVALPKVFAQIDKP